MPMVTVRVVGGTDKENLQAITVATQRWGENGIPWGTAQQVAPGNAPMAFYYSNRPITTEDFDLEDRTALLEITADGPGNTGVKVVYS